jgi:enoyl-CoA hydratase/carnithine racemase
MSEAQGGDAQAGDIRVVVAGGVMSGVMEVILARPAKKNALTSAMYARLADALAQADADPEVRCVLFRAEGADFCAGNDLGDFLAAGPDALGPGAPVMRFLHALAEARVVLAAAVQGRAVGVGATLLLHCDFVVADPNASLVLPFVKLGLTPEAGSSLLLPARVGPRAAAEMVLLGRPVDAERAYALGLVNQVSPDPKSAARALAQEAARQPAQALLAARALLRRSGDSLSERIDHEAQVFLRQLQTADFQERARAFFAREKD